MNLTPFDKENPPQDPGQLKTLIDERVAENDVQMQARNTTLENIRVISDDLVILNREIDYIFGRRDRPGDEEGIIQPGIPGEGQN